MLTDIFAGRYAKRILWEQYTETEAKLLTQCFRIIAEQLIPCWTDGKESDTTKVKWQSLHDRLSMELGLDELAPKHYSYRTTVMGQPFTQVGSWTMEKVCRDFVCAKYTGAMSPDRFMKERISFVELAFRLCEEELASLNQNLPGTLSAVNLQNQAGLVPGQRPPRRWADVLQTRYDSMNARFQQNVAELNERFRRVGTQLNYHNGFIQVAADQLVEQQIEGPFWAIVADPLWKNVDIDMKEALDRRDANDKDPAFYAARCALSTICWPLSGR
jgi:hypothetical protein